MTQILTWGITIFVIRLLTPNDYGLLAIATLFVSFLVMLAEAGLGAALVQAAELDDLRLRQMFGTVMVIHSALFVLQVAAAPAIAHFFGEDRLVLIIQVLAVQLLLSIFSVIPASLLARTLDFKRSSLIGVVSALCGGLSTLWLASLGYGVWALVMGALITQLVTSVAFNLASPFLRWPAFSFNGTRSFIAFGGQITAAGILRFVYSQADVFIAGKLLGKEALGFYSISMHLASLPVQRLSSVVNQVAFPAFAQAQRQRDQVARHLLKGIRVLSLFSFPVLWGISCVAQEIVEVLLGPKWGPAAIPLQLLALVMPIAMLSPFMNTAFQGMGHARIVFMNVFTACLVMPAVFWVGAQWGLIGLSLAWPIAFPLVFLLNLRRMLPLVGLKLTDALMAVALPALAAAGMYACVIAARAMLTSHHVPAPLLMAILVATGAAGYAVITLATNKSGIREMVALVHGGFARVKPT